MFLPTNQVDEMRGDASRVQPAKLRLIELSQLDGRTRAARRAREIVSQLSAELGGKLSPIQNAAVERAAALLALAEDARTRRLAGDEAVGLNDLVRIDGSADRALRRLRSITANPSPSSMTLRDYLRTQGA